MAGRARSRAKPACTLKAGRPPIQAAEGLE